MSDSLARSSKGQQPFDIVVPSAKSLDLLAVTMSALGRAVRRAGVEPKSVVVCDERPRGAEFASLVASQGFTCIETRSGRPPAGRNAGAGVGRASYIIFVDDDVELDEEAVSRLSGLIERERGLDVVVGGLRPPADAPQWLRWAYEAATLTPASALAPTGRIAPVALGTGLVAIRRRHFEAVGGFPEVPGTEDALMGLRLQTYDPDLRIERRRALSGVHHYVPSWREWLMRGYTNGARLRELEDELDEATWQELVRAHHLGAELRGMLKRTLRFLPASFLKFARGRLLRRIAAASAEARGFGEGARP